MRQQTFEPQIDREYEQRVEQLSNLDGNVNDYPITSERPEPIKRQSTYLPATVERKTRIRPMSEAESAALQGVMQVPTMPQAQVISVPGKQAPAHTSHARHNDDPITNAQASLLYSAAYGFVAALVIGALLLLATFRYGVDIDWISGIGIEICGTGLVTLIVMAVNRQQGLHFSAPGIEHAQIKAETKQHAQVMSVEAERIHSQERIAMHAIDTHARLLEKRWQLEVSDHE